MQKKRGKNQIVQTHLHLFKQSVSVTSYKTNIICITSENMIKPMASLSKLFITFG